MASTNKTPKLGLNQWEPGDSVLREDFNGDNAKIEAALEPLVGSPKFDVIHGDGTDNREINVGFRPNFMIYMMMEPNSTRVYFVWNGGLYGIYRGTVNYLIGDVVFTDKGFRITKKETGNLLGYTAYYYAFR